MIKFIYINPKAGTSYNKLNSYKKKKKAITNLTNSNVNIKQISLLTQEARDNYLSRLQQKLLVACELLNT